MDSEKYNHIRANASNALTTAEIYLESAILLPSRPDPDLGDPMDIDVGEHTPSEAAIDNNPDMLAADEPVLELTVPKEERDLLYTNSSELSITNVPRNRTTSLHQEPANTEPADDDIVMTKKTQEEPKPEEEIVLSKTVRLDSHGHEEACLLNDPQPTEIEQPKLTSCQIYLQGQPDDPVKKAKPSVGHSTDRLRSPTKKRVPGTPETPPPTPVPPKPTQEYPDKTAIPVEDQPRPGMATPATTGKRKKKPKPKRRTGRHSANSYRKSQKWSPRNC